MSTTKPSTELPRALPYESAPNISELADLTNLIIGDSIWARRKQARMSETKLANKLNRNRSFVRAVESGRHSTTLTEFKSLAEALNLDHLKFAEEVLDEIVIASKALTVIAEPDVFLIGPSEQKDTHGNAKEDVQEDAQGNKKKGEKGTYRKTFRKKHKMPPKFNARDSREDAKDADSKEENAEGADPEGPAPDDQ